MLETYRATIQRGRIEWQDDGPQDDQPIQVQVTVLKASPLDTEKSGEAMAAALQKLADNGGIGNIVDPVEWQREIRQDRVLPGREQ